MARRASHGLTTVNCWLYVAWVWGLTWCAVGTLRAQEPPDASPERPTAEHPPDRPPKVLELPSIVWPESQPWHGERRVLAIVIVDTAGHAVLESTDADGPLREGIEDALRRARFSPARVAGRTVSARVQVALHLEAPLSTGSSEPAEDGEPMLPGIATVAAEDTIASAPAEGDASENIPPLLFQAVGRGRKNRPNERRLSLEATRELPGAFGDPFRAIDTLPGVVPMLSGLPYFYVRGAPPSGTVFFYDDIPLPALFHLGVASAVIHPGMVGDLGFYPGVAPGRYGRRTGGVVTAGADPAPDKPINELELRLIDMGGMVSTPLEGGGSVQMAGRYGYPGLLLSLLSPESVLAYWDYQTRVDVPINARDRFQLVWLGSFDRAGERSQRQGITNVQALTLEFHRVEARWIRRVGRYEFGTALQFGMDRSEEKDTYVRAARMGPRAWLAAVETNGMRWRVGADMTGIVGHMQAESLDLRSDLNNPLYTSATARNMSGAYAELEVPLAPRLVLESGLRGDVWITGTRAQAAVEPRGVLRWQTTDTVDLHVGAGIAHQPAVFLIPLPGIADVALDHGLQRALQSEVGVGVNLPAGFRAEAQVYWHQHRNMILPELVVDSYDCTAFGTGFDLTGAPIVCERDGGFPRASARAFGTELLLKRASSERISGWLGYTLGWAQARADEGFDFRPSFDIRHVANLVLQARLLGGWHTGIRLHYRTGRVGAFTFTRPTPTRYEQQLPAFFRADVQTNYAWRLRWGELRLGLEWFNLTMAREAIAMQCRQGVLEGRNPVESTPCPVRYAPAIFLPNLSLRASF